MAWDAQILADSKNWKTSDRLTTFVVTYPRFIHSELMTHRMLSRNAASSRAIPIQKVIDQVMTDPAMPIHWGKNQSGMQALEEMEWQDKQASQLAWLKARDNAVTQAQVLNSIGAHKQIVNRLLEPFTWMTVIVTASQWNNFWHLRCHPAAQPEFQHIATMMKAAYDESQPAMIGVCDWHLPFVTAKERAELRLRFDYLRKLSTGRCARVSYLTHDGVRDPEKDIELHDKLLKYGHWSPFEHCAMALGRSRWSGNFRGWQQYRKFFKDENVEG